VEPFAGSFAVIKTFYKDCDKYKFHINDNDEDLSYVYRNYQEYLDEYHKVVDLYNNEYKNVKLSKNSNLTSITLTFTRA
jgi:site-specific DNA-adenine methylase